MNIYCIFIKAKEQNDSKKINSIQSHIISYPIYYLKFLWNELGLKLILQFGAFSKFGNIRDGESSYATSPLEDSFESLVFQMNHLIRNTTIGFNLKIAICNNYLDENRSGKCFSFLEKALLKLKSVFHDLDDSRFCSFVRKFKWLLLLKLMTGDFAIVTALRKILFSIRIRRKRATGCVPKLLVGGMTKSSKASTRFVSNHVLPDEVFGKVVHNLDDVQVKNVDFLNENINFRKGKKWIIKN